MSRSLVAALVLLCLQSSAGRAETPTRVRGTLASVDATTLHVTRKDGTDAALTTAPDLRITAVIASSLGEVKPGSFIGTAARTQADGTLRAVEVHVFPENMRGTGEGHTPFDLGPQSTMTNGTVGQEVVGAAGDTLTVRYKGGEKTIVVPPDVPVVTFEPGNRAMLVPGAHVIAFASESPDHTLTVRQIAVGKDGLTPPM